MPDLTPNYGFKKPLQNENYNVDIQNENMDIVDEQLKERDSRVGPLASLTTLIKTSIVNAINSLRGEVAAHKADLASQELNKGASLIGINDKDNKFAATNVEGALKELFINVSDGKQVVATAITGKGVPTSGSDTFGKMATNIGAITTDPSIGTTNAVAADILLGKKAISQGQLVTGTIPTFGGFPIATDFHPYGTGTADGGNNIYLKMPAGYSNGSHWLSFKDPNLIPANVKAGVSLGQGMKLNGTFTSDATIPDASWMLSGASAYKNGVKIDGTMPNHGNWAVNATTQGAVTYIPSGYHAGGGYVYSNFTNLVAGNIRSGVNVGGVVGTLGLKTKVLTHSANNSSRVIRETFTFEPLMFSVIWRADVESGGALVSINELPWRTSDYSCKISKINSTTFDIEITGGWGQWGFITVVGM